MNNQEALFEYPNGLFISTGTMQEAKYACKNWHYSKTWPSAPHEIFSVRESGVFIGCVIFGPSIQNAVATEWGLTWDSCSELVRVALDMHSEFVTRIIAVCLRKFKKLHPQQRLVISYADKSRHEGKIYFAGNWIYLGETVPCKMMILNGIRLSARSFRHYGLSQTGQEKTESYTKNKFAYPLDKEMRTKLSERSVPYPSGRGGIVATCPL